jgi:hypothetical protein
MCLLVILFVAKISPKRIFCGGVKLNYFYGVSRVSDEHPSNGESFSLLFYFDV